MQGLLPLQRWYDPLELASIATAGKDLLVDRLASQVNTWVSESKRDVAVQLVNRLSERLWVIEPPTPAPTAGLFALKLVKPKSLLLAVGGNDGQGLVLGNLSETQELLLLVLSKTAAMIKMTMDELKDAVSDDLISSVMLALVMFNPDNAKIDREGYSVLVEFNRFIIHSYVNGTLDNEHETLYSRSLHPCVEFLDASMHYCSNEKAVKIAAELADFCFYSDDHSKLNYYLDKVRSFDAWRTVTGINTRRIEALLSFQNLSHTTPTTNPPHPSLATLFQLSDVGDVYDIDAILLHPLRSSIPSYLWREVASIAYDSGDVLSSLQLEVVGALVNTSSVSEMLGRMDPRFFARLSSFEDRSTLFDRLFRVVQTCCATKEVAPQKYKIGLALVTNLACRALATCEWKEILERENDNFTGLNELLLPKPIDTQKVKISHPNNSIEFRRCILLGPTLNALPMFSNTLARISTTEIITPAFAGLMKRAQWFCRQLDFKNAGTVLQVLTPHLSHLTSEMRCQVLMLSSICAELSEDGIIKQDSGLFQHTIPLLQLAPQSPMDISALVYLEAVNLKRLDQTSTTLSNLIYQSLLNSLDTRTMATTEGLVQLNIMLAFSQSISLVLTILGFTRGKNDSVVDSDIIETLEAMDEINLHKLRDTSFELAKLLLLDGANTELKLRVHDIFIESLKASKNTKVITIVASLLSGVLSSVQNEMDKINLVNFGSASIVTSNPEDARINFLPSGGNLIDSLRRAAPKDAGFVQNTVVELLSFLFRINQLALDMGENAHYKQFLSLGDVRFALGDYREAAKHYCQAISRVSDFVASPQHLDALWSSRPVLDRMIDCFRLVEDHMTVVFLSQLRGAPIEYNSMFNSIRLAFSSAKDETACKLLLEQVICLWDIGALEYALGLFKRKGDTPSMERVIKLIKDPALGLYTDVSRRSGFLMQSQTRFLRPLLLRWLPT